MRLDKQDIFPLSVVLLFGLAIPLGLWLGFGTRQQIARDLFSAARAVAIACLGFAIFIGWFTLRARRRSQRVLTERGEQDSSDFVAQFSGESEQHAATLIFERLSKMSAMKRMPRLERRDQLSGPPLFIVPEDLTEELETLCEDLDFSLMLDPDGAIALHNAKTVEQLVLALTHFIEQQGAKPVAERDCGATADSPG